MKAAHQLGAGLKLLAAARLTLLVVLVWVTIEVWKSYRFSDPEDLYRSVGLIREFLNPFKLWQLLSYGMVHNGWLHLLMNAVLLMSAATHLEWIVGWRKVGLIILGGILAGGLLHLALSPSLDLLIGGSGGVFAAMLCLMTLSPESRWLMPFSISAKNLGRGLVAASAILLLIHPVSGIPGLSELGRSIADAGFGEVFRIGHACHLGGALAGWLAARWILRSRVSLERLQRDRARREQAN